MLSLHLIENFLRFQVQDKHNASSFSRMSFFFSYVLESCLNPTAKLVKSRNNKHSTGELLRHRGVFYNFSPRFWFLLLAGSPNASINSSFLRLNQLTCETPSILRSNVPSEVSLSEQTEPSVLKSCRNSEE